jgi:heme-degrading monooxygenase HmoA
MHALVTKVNIERDDEEDRRNLTESVAPNVARSPGFVAGYWLEAGDDGEAISVVFFDSEPAAKAGAEMAQQFFASDRAPRAVRLKSAEVRGVAANS